MRAAVLHEVGGPLSVEDVPEPEPESGQSLVDVRAAGINFADVLIRNGHYPQPPQLPTILGNEVAGDIGGRRVFAFVRGTGGGYAERWSRTTSGSSTSRRGELRRGRRS